MTVSELNLKAKSLLESHLNDIVLSGEISKITFHNSGHWYFDLKDEKASLACVMFKGANLSVCFKPCVGDLVELKGGVSLYESTARFQFMAKSMQKQGFGDLEAQFLALKERLEKEGLFDLNLKKQILAYPSKIAIITSFTSAALQDMLKLLRQKDYALAKIYVFNALTQGKEAPLSLIKALEKADEMGFDFIIIARGGGSREDLFCFNDEGLARSIFKAKTPIISAIGHEIDYVISDFVADFRAPTPSAAIDLLVPSQSSLEQNLDFLQDAFTKVLQHKFTHINLRLENLEKMLKSNSLSKIIEQNFAQISFLEKSLTQNLNNRFKQNELKILSLKQLFSQQAQFFEKTKDLISLEKNGVKTSLKNLQKDDIITLKSQNESKEAKIL